MKKLVAIVLTVLMIATLGSLFACEKAETSIVFASTTELSGDWGLAQWTNNAADKDIRDLIDGYSPVSMTKGGEYLYDPMVCDGDPISTVNEDGSKTIVINLQKDMKWNDGTGITAKNYVATYLLFSSNVSVLCDATGGYGRPLVGYADYNKGGTAVVDADGNATGETNAMVPFSGVRLLGDYSFSVTISPEYLPYYFDITYAGCTPIPMSQWLPADVDVADDGNGAYFTGTFTYDACASTINNGRYLSEGRISCGPYQLVSFDAAAYEAVMTINPEFKGTFDGQKPSIDKLVYVKAVQETMLDALKTGQIDVITGFTDGSEIKAGLDLVDAGGFSYCDYERNGYGKLMFQCDFGPTQFVAVRRAIAHLLDRNEFANTFCQGYGSVVHGPYGLAMWMYQDSKAELDAKLDTFTYSVDDAINLLVADGWVYDATGADYVSGVRYKKVTTEEAGDYAHNVKLADGTILMPLIIEWASSEGNSVSGLLKVMLAEGTQTAQAGVQINQSVMTFPELLNYMYRDASSGDQYGVPTYGMYNLATNFTAAYDMSYNYTLDPALVAQGYNTNFIFDETLDQLSMDMVYKVESSDSASYLRYWTDFVIRWNELAVEVPLYSNVYYDIYNSKLVDYDVTSLWEFTSAILYAHVEG